MITSQWRVNGARSFKVLYTLVYLQYVALIRTYSSGDPNRFILLYRVNCLLGCHSTGRPFGKISFPISITGQQHPEITKHPFVSGCSATPKPLMCWWDVVLYIPKGTGQTKNSQSTMLNHFVAMIYIDGITSIGLLLLPSWDQTEVSHDYGECPLHCLSCRDTAWG